MKREFRFAIGHEQHPVVGVTGTVELEGSHWKATIVPHEGAKPVEQLAASQIQAVLGCIERYVTGKA